MAKLDRSRDFSTVHGTEFSAAYGQDGKYFDSAGEEVGATVEPIVEEPTPAVAEVKPSSKAKAKAAIDEVNSLV
jgi:hypothetical protein